MGRNELRRFGVGRKNRRSERWALEVGVFVVSLPGDSARDPASRIWLSADVWVLIKIRAKAGT